MAGYKQWALDDSNIAAFWTFDSELVNQNGNLTSGSIINDEVDFQSQGSLVYTHDDSYRFMNSLIQLEPTDQKRLTICPIGKVGNNWENAYVYIPHTSAFSFPHLGSFTVEFVMRKSAETEYINELRDAGNYYYGFNRSLFHKDGVISIYLQYAWNAQAFNFVVVHPGGTFTVNANAFRGKNLINEELHIVVSWDVIPDTTGNFDFEERCTFYINAMEAASYYKGVFDNVTNTNVSSNIYIGGISTQFQTSALHIDQVAVYDRGLRVGDVATHYKKIYRYEDMCHHSYPTYYWKMYDDNNLNVLTMLESISGLHGEYDSYNNGADVVREELGPSTIVDSHSTLFNAPSCAHVFKYYAYNGADAKIMTVTSDYTVEFWFKSAVGSPGLLFSCQQKEFPFTGVLVMLNMDGDIATGGSLTFSERVGVNLVTPTIYDGKPVIMNDDKWHYVTVLRNQSVLQLWVDGIKMAEQTAAMQTTQDIPSHIHLMGMYPGGNYVDGNMCNLAVYPYPLTIGQIQARATYNVVYSITGVITLRGTPLRAIIRAYSTQTGELLKEVYSEEINGSYRLELRTNQKIDLLVYDPNDKNVIYRCFGPILPVESLDLPIII